MTNTGLVLARNETIVGLGVSCIAKKNADVAINSEHAIKRRVRFDALGSALKEIGFLLYQLYRAFHIKAMPNHKTPKLAKLTSCIASLLKMYTFENVMVAKRVIKEPFSCFESFIDHGLFAR